MDECTLLVPVNGSENSVNGLKYAMGIAKEKKAVIHVLFVPEGSDQGSQAFPHQKLIDSIKECGIKITELRGQGDISGEIIRTATELEPDLIIMGPDVFNKKKKFYDESVTGKVIRSGISTILIVPPNVGYQGMKNLLFGVDMRDNLFEPVQKLLRIFRDAQPYIDLLVFPDRFPQWHFKEDVTQMIQHIKNYTEYINLSVSISDHKNTCTGLDLYASRTNTDLICVENNTDVFHHLFFKCKDTPGISHLLNKAFLILPGYATDSIKK